VEAKLEVEVGVEVKMGMGCEGGGWMGDPKDALILLSS